LSELWYPENFGMLKYVSVFVVLVHIQLDKVPGYQLPGRCHWVKTCPDDYETPIPGYSEQRTSQSRFGWCQQLTSTEPALMKEAA
jgi:hypothetical protein